MMSVMAAAPAWLRPAASASGPASRVQRPDAQPHWLQPLPIATVPERRDQRPSWLQPSATAGGRHSSAAAEYRSSGGGSTSLAETTTGRHAQSHQERPPWLRPAQSHQERPAWLRPSASAEASPQGRKRPSWLQPSASAESGPPGGTRPSWLQPSASSVPRPADPAQPAPKRVRRNDGPQEADSAPVRSIHLDMACVLMAGETLTASTAYTRNAVDPDRIRRVLRKPCDCAGNACTARSLCIAPVTSFLQRFHALPVETKALLVSTAYDTAGPRPEDRVAQVRARCMWIMYVIALVSNVCFMGCPRRCVSCSSVEPMFPL